MRRDSAVAEAFNSAYCQKPHRVASSALVSLLFSLEVEVVVETGHNRHPFGWGRETVTASVVEVVG
jgi:hypothetical protein